MSDRLPAFPEKRVLLNYPSYASERFTRHVRNFFFFGGHSYYEGALTNLPVLSPSLQTGDGGVSLLLTELMAAASAGRIQADAD